MYKVKNKEELRKIVYEGKIPLETLDVSNITDMNNIFFSINEIKGSISDWDVSNVKYMHYAFATSKISPDISKWDVSNVINMDAMFQDSTFNGDISKWNVSNVKDMSNMFEDSKFNGDISIQANEPWRVRKWNTSSVKSMYSMFYQSEFNQDIGKWDISNVVDFGNMFYNSQFSHNLGAWDFLMPKDSTNIIERSTLFNVFNKSIYSLSQYEKDRKKYLENIELEKDKKYNEYLKNEANKINKELSKDIDLDTIEMEF